MPPRAPRCSCPQARRTPTASSPSSTRYLIFLTPRLDRLITRLHRLSDPSELRATLAEFDTVLVE